MNFIKQFYHRIVQRLSLDKIYHRLYYGYKLLVSKDSNAKPPDSHTYLKILLFELIDLFEKEEIVYWIDHGTLLGCLRIGKILPWDDDVDISCLYSDKEKVEKLLKSTQRHFVEQSNHFKIFYSRGSYLHLDIFFYQEIIPDILVLTVGYIEHIDKVDIYNMIQKKFYSRSVNVPGNAEKYLRRKWGINWKTREDRYISGTAKYYYANKKTLKRDFEETRILAYSLHAENQDLKMEVPMNVDNQYFDSKEIEANNDYALFTRNGKYAKHVNKQIIWVDRSEASHFILGERNRLSIKKTADNFWAEHKITAILLAAGQGERYSNEIPKQFVQINDFPIIYYSLKTLEASDIISEIVIAVQKEYFSFAEKLIEKSNFTKSRIVEGGFTRDATIYNCLKTIQTADFVLLHDAVRPFIQENDIRKLVKFAPFYDMVIYSAPLKGGLCKISPDFHNIETLDKNDFAETHSPHIISFPYMKNIKDKNYNVSGNCKFIHTTSDTIFKITYPQDLPYVKSLIDSQINTRHFEL